MLEAHPLLLFAMRLRGVWNGVRRKPAQVLFGLGLLGLVYWGVFSATKRGVHFVDRFLRFGNEDIADAVLQRSLETLFLVLVLGVTFSVLTTAVHTLYSSQDLPFLLGLPVSAASVFTLKVAETYVGAALLPALFTLPALLALGAARGAPPAYYGLALTAVGALYALPVALGCVLALLLMRVAPAGRVKEIATGASVVLAALFVLGLRVLRPERLATMSLEELSGFLTRFASFELNWLPTSWASQAVWGALDGRITVGAYVLAGFSLLLLWGSARLAALAYREGWIRALDTSAPSTRARPNSTRAHAVQEGSSASSTASARRARWSPKTSNCCGAIRPSGRSFWCWSRSLGCTYLAWAVLRWRARTTSAFATRSARSTCCSWAFCSRVLVCA